MSKSGSYMDQTSRSKGGKFLPAFCNIIGFLLIIIGIVVCLPLSSQTLMNYKLFNIVSPSMEPEIPVGSLIIVQDAAPEDIQEGDIIAFMDGGSVVSHRVVENKVIEGEFVTKGDANQSEDFNAVPYNMLVGQVKYHFRALGQFMELLTTSPGKVLMLVIAACGVMLNMLATRLRDIEAVKRKTRKL